MINFVERIAIGRVQYFHLELSRQLRIYRSILVIVAKVPDVTEDTKSV